MHMPHTLDWDGEHLPEQLKRLPPGRYVLIEADASEVRLSTGGRDRAHRGPALGAPHERPGAVAATP